MESNLLTKTGPVKRIKINQEVPDVVKNQDRVAAITPVLQVLTSFSKKKKIISLRSKVLIGGGKDITPLSVSRKKI